MTYDIAWVTAYTHRRAAELSNVKPSLAAELLYRYQQARTAREADRVGMDIENEANQARSEQARKEWR